MGSRRERGVVILLLLVFVILAILAAPDDDQNTFDLRPSSFRGSPHGARALYLTLRELDVPAARRLAPYVDADSLAGPLVLLAPTQPPTPAELSALARWIEAGGTLIYVARDGDATLDTLGLALRPLAPDTLDEPGTDREAGRSATPRPHRWTAEIGRVRGFRRGFADSSRVLESGRATPLLVTERGEVVALTFRRGRGTIIAWSDPQPLSNQALRTSGAALLFARTAAEATQRGDTLRFDEYHHGYRPGGGPVAATLGFLWNSAAGHAAIQLAVAGLGLLLLLGRRLGSPRPPPPARRRSPIEHVEALAGAYRLAGARRTARRLILAGLARRLGRPPPPEGGEREFLTRLATRLPAGHESARALLAEWDRGDHADLATLTRYTDQLITERKQL